MKLKPVYAEMPPDIPQKIHISQFRQPIGVVGHDGTVTAKIDEIGKLFFQTQGIIVNLFTAHDPAHLGFSAGVSYQRRTATHQHNRPMTGILHVHQAHDGQQAPHMEAFCRRIKTDITGGGLRKHLRKRSFVGGLLKESPVFKNF